MIKRRIQFAICCCLALAVSFGEANAAPVSPVTAERAAMSWLSRSRAPGVRRNAAVRRAHRVAFRHDGIEAAANLVSLEGGGFVVVAPDDRIEPVIFHSPDGEVCETDDGGPFWALLKADLACRMAAVNEAETGAVVHVAFAAAGNNDSGLRGLSPQEAVAEASAKWADLLADESGDDSRDGVRKDVLFGDGVSSIADVRVAPLLDSSWGQSWAGGGNCYNYYTPNNYVCGCVATAVSQVMRYHKYPTSSVAAKTFDCKVNGTTKSLAMKGGTYSWNSMPGTPTSSMTTAQRQAIGKICYDVGVACQMNYASGGSGASSFRPVFVLKQVFGYSNVLPVTYTYSNYSWTLDRFKSIIVPNCDAGLPVLVSVPGHAIVADGYGYDSNLFYVHLNMGWDGSDNLWYNPPTVYTTQYLFSGFQDAMANIFTTQAAGSSIASGKVLSSAGKAVSGATVRATCSGKSDVTDTTDANGIYGLILPAGTWKITVTSGTATGTKTVTMSNSSGTQTYDEGSYNPYVTPVINNLYDQNITLSAAVVAPSAPTGVSATDGSSTANVTVKWNSVSGATSYHVYRATSSTGAKTELGSWQTSCSYTDASATPGTQYYYWVKAKNSGGMSGFSSSNTGYRKLSKPTSVSATDGTSSAEVTVTWSVVTGASYYRVYRSTTSIGTKAALGSWQTSCTYKDSGATAGTTYYYFVQAAVDNSGLRPGDYSAYDTGYKAVVKRPPNDTFAKATVISGQRCTSGGSNKDAAQKESGEPSHAGYATATSSIWWKWTAPHKGKVQIDTIGSSIDTVLAVYTGSSVGALTSVAYDDDNGEGFTSRVDFTAAKGTTYSIAVSGVSGEYGDIVLNLQQFPEGQTAISKAGVSTSGKMQFSFKAQAGKTYYVQRATSLANGGNWTTVQTIKPTATSVQSVEAEIDTSKQSGFYRIVTAE